ncbi:uL22 family ribosomal protein [Candidatus Vidania fulgoroideorum]
MIRLEYKNISISLKKIKIYIKILKNKKFSKIINFLNKLNNKSSLILKKILLSSLYSYKNHKIYNIYATKSFKILKRNFRAKGKMDFLNKRFCNINILLK